MRIIHIVNNLKRIGGIETYVYDLLPELEYLGHDNVLIYCNGESYSPIEGVKAKYHLPITNSPPQDRTFINNIISTESPDVIYLHNLYNPHLITAISEIVPTVGYSHIFYPVCPGLSKLFSIGDIICERPFGLGCIPMIYIRRCASARNPLNIYRIMNSTKNYLSAYRRLPRVIVGSKYMQYLLCQNGIDVRKIEVLPPHFIHLRSNREKSFETSSEILYVGRLEYEKGLQYLLKSMCLIPEQYRLVVVGDGSLMENYRKMTNEFGLSKRVTFTGWLSGKDLERAYQRSHVVVMPTIMAEPFGKVGIEAMTHNKPVVAFDVGGISEWLNDGHNGFLIPVRDINQLGNRITQVLEDRDLRLRLGTNGNNYVHEQFKASDHIERLIGIFKDVVRNWHLQYH